MIIESNLRIKYSLLFIVKFFVGTSYFFKISKTAVYICPFKTSYVKMKTIFSLKVILKVNY